MFKKYRILYLAELVALLASLVLFLVPKAHYTFGADAFEYENGAYLEGLFDVTEPGIYIDNGIAEAGAQVFTPRADLHPGSYKVYLKYLNTDNNNTYSAVSDYNTNSVVNGRINANLGITEDPDYAKEITLNTWQKVTGYQISYNFSGNGYMYLYGLDIVETNWWKTEVLLIVLLISLVLDFVLYLRDTRDSKDLFTYFYAFVLAIITSMLSLAVYFFGGHDASYHLGRMEALAQAIAVGNLPLRVSDYWVGGLGYASSLFYCDIFLFPAACLRALGATLQGSWKVYTVMVNLATAFIGLYSFKRITRSRTGALAALTLYMLSAYRMACMYLRFAIGDFSVQMFLPLVLYGIIHIYEECESSETILESFKRSLPFALGVSGLVLTHIQTTLMTAILVFAFVIINFKKTFRKTTMCRLISSLAVVLILNMWYIFPFLEMSGYLKVMHLGGREGMYRANGTYLWQLFNLFPVGSGYSYTAYESVAYAFDAEIPFTIAPAAIGVFAYLMLRLSGLVGKDNADRSLVRKADKILIATLAVIYMTTIYFPWDFVEQLCTTTELITNTLMCPWRFLGIAWTFASALSGMVVVFLINDKKLLSRFTALYIAVITVVAAIGGGYFMTTRATSSDWKYLYDKEDFTEANIIGGEYLPGDVTDESLACTSPVPGEGIEVSEWNRQPRVIHVAVMNSSDGDSYVDVPYLFYKGYRAVDEENGTSLKTASNGSGLTRVTIPSGFDGKIKVYYKEPGYFKLYEVISIIATILLVAFAVTGGNLIKGKKNA